MIPDTVETDRLVGAMTFRWAPLSPATASQMTPSVPSFVDVELRRGWGRLVGDACGL